MNNTDSRCREHMANERTFLAWVRTSIGIMAFGFVVEKFGLFIRQLTLLVGTHPSTLQGYSSVFGIVLIAFGVLISLLAFASYKKTEKQIDNNTYAPSPFLNTFLTVSIVGIGLFLIFYLNSSGVQG